MTSLITIQDAIIVPFLLLLAYFIATKIRNKHISEKPYYKYFRIGLFIKIWAGLAFTAIYLFYYGGGDTIYYFWGTGNIVKMFSKDISTFFKLLAGDHSPEVFSMFDRNTGWPTYFKDPNSFSVCRLNVPFYILSFRSFLGNTIIMNVILYFGVWQFFQIINKLFPKNEKQLALALLFIPSVIFWSSGILKDGWTFVAVLGIYSSVYHIFIEKNKTLLQLFAFLFWSYVSFSIRPFMFYVAISSTLVWIGFTAIKAIKSRFLRTIALPFVLLVIWFVGSITIARTGSLANSRYASVDAMLETAWIIQDDLKKDYYGGNSFDIGSFEPTLSGIVKKAPKAIVAGTLRPFIWEGSGILLFIAGIENLILLGLFIYILFRTGVFSLFKNIYNDPLLLSMFTFAITYAFLVGLTTANFGALIRYKIPVVPFILFVFIISNNNRASNNF